MNRTTICRCILLAVASVCIPQASAQRTAVSPVPREQISITDDATLPLPRPQEAQPRVESSGGLDSSGRVIMSLSVVLGAFFLVAWLGRKRIRVNAELPEEAVEVLGNVTLGPRETARLIRIGSKLLLVASTTSGLTTLTEVTDIDEVEELTRLCVHDSDARWRREAA